MATATSELVTVDDKGVAYVVGGRIEVTKILMHLRAGFTEQDLLKYYPHLSADDLRAAQAYADEHREAVEAQIQTILDEADRRYREAMEARANGTEVIKPPKSHPFDAEKYEAELAVNRRAYAEQEAAIRAEHLGKWVGFAFGHVIATDDDIDVVSAAMEALDPQPQSCSICRAGCKPNFEVYYDTYAEYS
jgi:uncharacterized protein (DUF433 family)